MLRLNEGRTILLNLQGISRFPHASRSVSFPRKATRLMGFPRFRAHRQIKDERGSGKNRQDTYLSFVHLNECD